MRLTDARPRHGLRALCAVLAFALVAAACGSDDSGEAGEPTGATSDVSEKGDPVHGGSITVGLEAETNSWLPGSGNFGNPGVTVAYAIYDPLMKRSADGEVRPYLAESLEPNGDLTEWTLTLREGIEFHDGTPLDAEALKTIFDEYLTAPDSNLLGSLGNVEEMVVDDELTVTYHLKGPDSAFPDVLTLAAGWPFSPTAAAEAGDDAGARPVGTGPFVFDSWERDSKLVVKKNENYWQEGLPYLDEIVFRPIPDEDTRVSSLSTGDIDVMQSLRQSTIVKAREIDGVDNYENLGNNTGVTIFNTEKPPVDDVRVRKALAMALDQEQLIAVLGGEGIVPASNQYFSEEDPYWSEKAAAVYPDYDPEAAQELLQEYIDDPDRSDGKKPGEPISFRYDCPPDPSLNELTQLYQAFWDAIGVKVELRQVEQATHIDEALAGDYQAKCFRVGGQQDPLFILRNAYGEGSPTNFTRFTDPAIADALEQLQGTTDVDERKAYVEEIMTVANENVPVTFTGSTLTVVAARDVVKNLDGWTFPDGTEGNGVPEATTMWGFVWTTE